jgi:hypothetical protein
VSFEIEGKGAGVGRGEEGEASGVPTSVRTLGASAARANKAGAATRAGNSNKGQSG